MSTPNACQIKQFQLYAFNLAPHAAWLCVLLLNVSFCYFVVWDALILNFSFEHIGSMVRILLDVVFLYIIIFIWFFVYDLIYDQLLTNAFPTTVLLGFCRCVNVNWIKISENDNCLVCSMCFTWFTSLIEEYKVGCIHKTMKRKKNPYQNPISGFEPTPKVTSLDLKT